MTTDNKTLADVQPGGRVRLGDGLPPCPFCGHSDFDQWPCEYIDASGANVVRCARCHAAAPMKVWHTLSAQPSPGGQDAAIKAMAESLLCAESSATLEDAREQAALLLADALPHLVARQPVGDQCPDDLAVDAFAAAMKAKMAAARAKGRGGWEDPAQCTAEDLSRMLRNHVEKGDPRDVANFCMMLHQRGEAIAARQPVGEPVAWRYRAQGDKTKWYYSDTESLLGLYQPLYAAPPAQAVDLGAMPEGWRLSKKATCYQLSHGNDIIGNLVGPDAEENAAIIARVLDSQAVGNGN